ncbi:HAD family hydrolase [Alkalicoccus urumqiensis]|uniref:HAD family hydrolase n=1 Tax=Alkalicoccus urumqiensis TaxID=1548213 RepID=UPI001FDECB5A|nr:HAD family hydrolase [Alkalicoccus urumqiensis]
MKAVLFDLDGTLLDRDTSVRAFIDHQYDRFWNGAGVKTAYIRRFLELDAGGYVWKDRVYQQLAVEFPQLKLSWKVLLDDYVDRFQEEAQGFSGLHAMLRSLRESGLLLGIITNGRGHFQQRNIDALDIGAYMDIVLISEWEKVKKPDPAIFMQALKRLNVAPAASVFIGDHPINDIEAAKGVGMRTIWKRGPGVEPAAADAVVDRLLDVPEVMERWNQ